MADCILKADGLTKTIGRKTIVSGLSFELNKGEIFGFLGPNGAGKTTTIRMIAGLSHITAGDVFIDGVSVKRDFKRAIRSVGCIVENPDLYPYLSGIDNLRIFAQMYRLPESRVAEMLKTVGLESAARQKVKTYSLGMKQRLGLAQALLHEPGLLILDEPTNGLDPAGIRELRGMLRRLAAEKGMSVFVSSHILAEMQQMCDRVGIISRGKMVTVTTVEALLAMAENGGRASLLLKTDDSGRARALLEAEGIAAQTEPDGLLIETPRERIPAIVQLLSSNGVSLFGMDSRETHSLEDIFLRLTGEGH